MISNVLLFLQTSCPAGAGLNKERTYYWTHSKNSWINSNDTILYWIL